MRIVIKGLKVGVKRLKTPGFSWSRYGVEIFSRRGEKNSAAKLSSMKIRVMG